MGNIYPQTHFLMKSATRVSLLPMPYLYLPLSWACQLHPEMPALQALWTVEMKRTITHLIPSLKDSTGDVLLYSTLEGMPLLFPQVPGEARTVPLAGEVWDLTANWESVLYSGMSFKDGHTGCLGDRMLLWRDAAVFLHLNACARELQESLGWPKDRAGQVLRTTVAQGHGKGLQAG